MKGQDVLFSSESAEWSTPQDLFDALHNEFQFTLDAAASAVNHKVPRYFDKELNGLAQDWAPHRVYLNPPYGREIDKWVAKAEAEMWKGALVVVLLPARTDTRYFRQNIWGKAAELRFIHGRLRFGGADNSAPFPSVLAVFRPNQHDCKCSLVDTRGKPIWPQSEPLPFRLSA